jgi:hypothetical protein
MGLYGFVIFWLAYFPRSIICFLNGVIMYQIRRIYHLLITRKNHHHGLERVFHFFYNIATEFQFSVEGHAKQWATVQQVQRDAKMVAWWETSVPILEVLLSMLYPGVTFHLIKGLEHLVSLDVGRTLRWLRRATLAGVPMGLANESLAADHTIGILERILAEHRASLAAGTETRSDFVQILEAYLQAGWPRAIRPAVQFESIFR